MQPHEHAGNMSRCQRKEDRKQESNIRGQLTCLRQSQFTRDACEMNWSGDRPNARDGCGGCNGIGNTAEPPARLDVYALSCSVDRMVGKHEISRVPHAMPSTETHRQRKQQPVAGCTPGSIWHRTAGLLKRFAMNDRPRRYAWIHSRL